MFKLGDKHHNISQIKYFCIDFMMKKSPRERFLLILALVLCVLFAFIDFVYAPLLESHNALSHLHKHSLEQFLLSADTMRDIHSRKLMQDEELSLKLKEANDIFSLFSNKPQTNIFELGRAIIAFAEQQHLLISRFSPSIELSSIDIEGSGEFEHILELLLFIESHSTLSLEHLSLRSHFATQTNERIKDDDENISFSIIVRDFSLYPQGTL